MSKRKARTNHRRDEKVFQRTASKSKAININPISYRGGIRL